MLTVSVNQRHRVEARTVCGNPARRTAAEVFAMSGPATAMAAGLEAFPAGTARPTRARQIAPLALRLRSTAGRAVRVAAAQAVMAETAAVRDLRVAPPAQDQAVVPVRQEAPLHPALAHRVLVLQAAALPAAAPTLVRVLLVAGAAARALLDPRDQGRTIVLNRSRPSVKCGRSRHAKRLNLMRKVFQFGAERWLALI
jgi:hypothetical protein